MKRCGILRTGAAALAAMLLMTGCPGGSVPASASPELLEPVNFQPDSAVVTKEDLSTVKYLNGAVIPYVEELSLTVDGVVEAMSLYVGQEVKKGELLVKFQEEDILYQIASLEEELAYLHDSEVFRKEQDELKLELARSELARMEDKVWSPKTTEEELALQRHTVAELDLSGQQGQELYELSVRQITSRIGELRSRLAGNRLNAPFDGQILAVTESVRQNAALTAYEPVAYLACPERMYVSAEYVSESALFAAERVYAKIGGTEYAVSPVPMSTSDFLEAASSGEPLKTKFTLDAPDSLVRMGDFAYVAVVSETAKSVLSIPANAIYRDSGGSYVYKIEDDQQIRCDVETGLTNTVKTEITSGLEEGDTVYVKD